MSSFNLEQPQRAEAITSQVLFLDDSPAGVSDHRTITAGKFLKTIQSNRQPVLVSALSRVTQCHIHPESHQGR